MSGAGESTIEREGTSGGAVAIVPARLASSRLPRKVLLAETGRPLVQHVVDAASRAASVERVVVAADDAEIARALEPFGTEVVLTRADHANGTSRLAEAAGLLGLSGSTVVVNVQGDEPEIEPTVIDAAVGALRASEAPMSTVVSPFAPGEDPSSPSIVKAVVSVRGMAMYFSRAPVPWDRDGDAAERVGAAGMPLKHVGLYAYRRSFLDAYQTLPETPLERTERLEQLRVLEHGYAIAAAVARAQHHGIDTRADYDAFAARERARTGGRSDSAAAPSNRGEPV